MLGIMAVFVLILKKPRVKKRDGRILLINTLEKTLKRFSITCNFGRIRPDNRWMCRTNNVSTLEVRTISQQIVDIDSLSNHVQLLLIDKL